MRWNRLRWCLALLLLLLFGGAARAQSAYITDTHQCAKDGVPDGPNLIRLTYHDAVSLAYSLTIVDDLSGAPLMQTDKIKPLLKPKLPPAGPAFSQLGLPPWSSPWGWLVWGKSLWGAGCGPRS
jgi:hypothetical protein